MRLDRKITPSRNRFATVSSREMGQLSRLDNILRKGRLRAVTGARLVFLSGEEVELRDNSLVVDCSVNCIKFKPKTQIFQGNQIILQYIMLPPFGDFLKSLKTTFQVFIV